MNSRQNATVEVRRKDTSLQGYSVVATIPITERSTRRFSLMSEDYIQLEFSLASAVHFAIGDYVDDELFGMFEVVDEQMPRYNTSTGGYDYTLKMEKDYMAWRRFIHCLIANGQRMESRWSLTDRLPVHAQQVADSVNAVIEATTLPPTHEGGISVCNGYGVDVTATNANDVKFISYEGVNIIEALDMIAEAWECEWWVTDDPVIYDNTRYAKTIHFGKCELENDPVEFTLGDNMVSMDIARDQQTFANRIYAYGGEQNVPEDYDRVLEFTLDYANTVNHLYCDTTRPLKPEMLVGDGSVTTYQFAMSSASSGVTNSRTIPAGRYSLDGILSSTLTSTNPGMMTTATAQFYISIGGQQTLLKSSLVSGTQGVDNSMMWDAQYYVINATGITLESAGATLATIDNGILVLNDSASVYFSIVWSSIPNSSQAATSSAKLTADSITQAKTFHIIYNGVTYTAILNRNGSSDPTEMRKFYINSIPSSFTMGAKFTIKEEDINWLKVPMSYFTPVYDTGTLAKVGSRRIHLPLADYPNRYIEADGVTQVVEEVVMFEDVFPQLALEITQVTTSEKEDTIEHADGSITREKWTQYHFYVQQVGGDEFNFRTEYMLDGRTLQAAFTSPSTYQTGGYMLGGMTFDVGFDNGLYTIIRNENYGAKLPNDIIKPQVGDTLFIVGWNPRAMNDLGMVEQAEELLAEKTEEYLNAIQEGQFTFTCRMMSDWPFTLEAERLKDRNGNTLVDASGNALFANNGYSNGSLISEGARVTVNNEALPNGSKTSRVIGYEYKLDIPFDTPTYTIGETEAYSRLKKIEKQLTKL